MEKWYKICLSGDIMKELIKKENIKLTLSATIYLVLGVLFCVFLNRMVDFSESAICFVFLIAGAVLLIVYGLLPADAKIFKVLVYALVMLIVGLLILFVRKFFIFALAAMIAFGGIQSIMDAIKEKKENKPWITQLIIGCIIVALAIAVIVLSGTNTAKNIIAIFLGITFLIEAVIEIVALVKIVKLAKAQEKNKAQLLKQTDGDFKPEEPAEAEVQTEVTEEQK